MRRKRWWATKGAARVKRQAERRAHREGRQRNVSETGEEASERGEDAGRKVGEEGEVVGDEGGGKGEEAG